MRKICVRLLNVSLKREISPKTRDVPVDRLEGSEEGAGLESLRTETACVAADSGVQLSVLCRDLSKAGGKRCMPVESAAITVDEADE